MEVEFQKGDEVVIVDGKKYSYTQTGSKGTIVHLGTLTADVSFYELSGDKYYGTLPHTFTIDLSKLQLLRKRVNQKEEKQMSDVRKEVADVFEKTDEAMLVSKEIAPDDYFLEGLIMKANKKDVLAEAYRRKCEREEK